MPRLTLSGSPEMLSITLLTISKFSRSLRSIMMAAHMVFLESVFSRAIDMSDSLRVRISCLAWRRSGFRS